MFKKIISILAAAVMLFAVFDFSAEVFAEDAAPASMYILIVAGQNEIETESETALFPLVMKNGSRVTDVPVTWSTTNTDVVALSTEGVSNYGVKVTPVAAGTATVTAVIDTNDVPDASNLSVLTANYTITVKASTREATISQEAADVKLGEKVTLTAALHDTENDIDITDGVTVGWSSSNEQVAAVDDNGVVTAVSEGNALIRAIVSGPDASWRFVTCDITVTPARYRLIISSNSAEVKAGEKITLNAEIYDENNNTVNDIDVTWTSSNTNAAIVSDGEVTGVGAGTATITAKITYLDNVTVQATYELTVNPPDETSATEESGSETEGTTEPPPAETDPSVTDPTGTAPAGTSPSIPSRPSSPSSPAVTTTTAAAEETTVTTTTAAEEIIYDDSPTEDVSVGAVVYADTEDLSESSSALIIILSTAAAAALIVLKKRFF